jgi:hypothetical protein
MGSPKPNITIPVDLTNPGQFFACCGLLELADRRWPDVEGWFSRGSFSIISSGAACSLAALLEVLDEGAVEQLDPQDNAASALRLAIVSPMLLNWWHDERSGGKQLKPWAGKQFAPLIFRLMNRAAAKAPLASPFDYSEAVFDSKGDKAKKKAISPFYFDARREGTSLDLGFSTDEQKMSVEAYPAVEWLALVGLQRFRPYIDDTTQPRSFVYTAWTEFLPVAVAAVMVSGIVPVCSCGSFRFTKPSRGGDYLSMFSRATRERRKHAR